MTPADPAEPPGLRVGVRLGVDVGTVRVGVARSDATGTLAVPVTTLKRGAGDLAELVRLVSEYQAIEVLVGLPLGMDGREGRAAAAARQYAIALAGVLGGEVPVRLVDERLSTVSATRDLRAAGRSARSGRAVVDQAAAVVIVTYALDRERATGAPCGDRVGDYG